MTYTAFSSSTGEIIARNLSVEDAAHEVLTDDGQTYRIIQKGDYYTIVCKPLNGSEVEWGSFVSFETDEAKAAAELYQQVVGFNHGGGVEVMSDADWDSIVDVCE